MIMNGLEFGIGHKILNGSDPIKGVVTFSTLRNHTLYMIQRGGIFYISKIINRWEVGCLIWKNATELNLAGRSALKWEAYVKMLSNMGLRFNMEGDCIHWIGGLAKGAPIVAKTYQWMLAHKEAQMDAHRGLQEF